LSEIGISDGILFASVRFSKKQKRPTSGALSKQNEKRQK